MDGYTRLLSADYFAAPGQSVAVVSMPVQQNVGVHVHEFAELTLITGGSAMHLTGAGRYPVAAGDVYFIPPEHAHGLAEATGLSLVNILFLPELLPPRDEELTRMPGFQALFESEPRYRDAQGFVGHLRLSPTAREHVLAIVRELENEVEAGRPGGRVIVHALLTQIVVSLARCYGGDNVSSDGRRLLAIQKAIRLIEEDKRVGLGLDGLAARVGMSASTFKRTFRSITGMAFTDFRQNTRMARACHLLRNTEKTITEIAMEAGFTDSNYFARQFRLRMGTTPREWRRLEQESPYFTPAW